MSIQQELVFGIKKLYPSVVVKKVDSGNFVDIHFPEINEKKGTHLFFNTSGNKIKLGFYCRDEEFVQSALIKTDVLEKYSQGVRLKANPEFDKVEEAVNAAQKLIDALGHQSGETDNVTQTDSQFNQAKEKMNQGDDFKRVERYFADENWDAVLTQTRTLIEKGGSEDEELGLLWYFLARAFYEKNELNQVIEPLSKSLKIKQDSDKHLLLAKVYKSLGNKEMAVEATMKAVDLGKTDVTVFRDAARLIIELENDFPKAIEILNSGIDKIEADPGKTRFLDLLYAERGNVLLFQKKYNEAAEDFQKALDIDNETHRGWRCSRLANAYKGAGNYTEAIKYFLESIQHDKNVETQDSFSQIGHCYFELKDYENAANYFEKAINLGINDAFVFYRIGFCFKHLNTKLKEGLEYLDKGISLAPNYKWLFLEKAEILMKLHDYNGALKAFSSVLKLDPKDTFAYYRAGVAYRLTGKYDQSVENLNKAISTNSKHKWSYYELGLAYLANGQKSEALMAFESANSLDTNWVHPMVERGKIYLMQNDLENARNCISKAIGIDPNQKWIHYFRGVCNHKDGKFETALDDYSSSKRFHKDSLEFFYNVESAKQSLPALVVTNVEDLIQKGNKPVLLKAFYQRASEERIASSGMYDIDKTMQYVNELIDFDENNSDSHYLKATFIDLFNLSTENSKETLEKCIELNPSHVPALILYGNKLKDIDEAIPFFGKAISIEPDNHKAHFSLGKKLLKHDRFEEAIPCFKNCLEIRETDASWSYLGECHLKTGHLDKAIEALETATKNNSYLHEAYYYLAEAYLKAGSVEKATTAIEKATNNYDLPKYYILQAEVYRQNKNKSDEADAYLRLASYVEITENKLEEQIKFLKNLDQTDQNNFSFLAVKRSISDAIINFILEKGPYAAKMHLAKNQSLKEDHLERLIASENYTVLEKAVAHPKIDENRLTEIIQTDDGSFNYSFGLLGALSNPNLKEELIQPLLSSPFNWVRQKAASLTKIKVSIEETDDKYILAGLLKNQNYTSEEKRLIAEKRSNSQPKVPVYKLQSDRVGIEEYVYGAFNYGSDTYISIKEEIIAAILDENVNSWSEYCENTWYDYGESEYGVKSLAEKILIKNPAINSEEVLSIDLPEINDFPVSTVLHNPNLINGSFIHETISSEDGRWRYSDFELESEFRPEFLHPQYGDFKRCITAYSYYDESAGVELEIDGEVENSKGTERDTSLYLVTNKGLLYLDFERIRSEITEKHGKTSKKLIEEYFEDMK